MDAKSKVASVKILETDEISQKVCIQCCSLCVKCYRFRQRSSQNSQKLWEEYNERKQLELSKIVYKKEINIDGNNSKKLEISKSIDNKITPPKEHPSIQQIKKQYPNLKFPLLQPNSHVQPYITLMTNEVSDWYQQRNSTTDTLFKVNEKSLKRPRSPEITSSSKNVQCNSSSEELVEIRADNMEKQNEPEKAVTKRFRNNEDHEKNIRMETNQIEWQTNNKQDDSEQSQNKIDSIKPKKTEEENLEETRKGKSSKEKVQIHNEVNSEQTQNKIDSIKPKKTEEENLEETRKGKSSKEKVQIDNEVNSEQTQNKIDSTTRKKRISEHTEEENLEETPKRKSSKREVEIDNEVNSEQTHHKTDSIRRKSSLFQPTEGIPKRKSNKREVELDNEVTNEKHDTKFDEMAKNVRQVDNKGQIEEKAADTSNNNKKKSSSVKEISELMETKKQKANKSSSKINTSKQEETQNKTSKLLEKNKEIENKSTNLAKEKEVCNKTGDKEKPINEVESRRAGKDSKEPVIDFCALREILRNSTHDETNNLESNVINTSTPPSDTATSPSLNNLQKISLIRSSDLIPCSEKAVCEKDSNNEMLRIRYVKFVCQSCQTHYSTLKRLRAHEKIYHASCTFCNLHLDSLEDRKKHMLFYCRNRTIKIPQVVLFKVDKQREMIAKYAKAFQFLNLNASSDTEKLIAQRTVTPMDLDPSESENNDRCAHSVHNCQQYKLNWNVNYYNDVINAVNLGEPNFSVNIYNMIKDRTFYSLDTIAENTISHEYYLKNLSLELCFQKVKIVLIYGKAMVYHYDKGKHLPTVTPKKDFWDKEAPIQPQINIKNLRGEDCQRTVSQTYIDLNHKTDKNNVNLLDNVKKITENVNNQILQEISTEAKGAQSVRNKTSLQNSNIKQNVVGHTNSVLSPQNASEVNKVLSQRRTEIEMQRTVPRNVVSHDNEVINEKRDTEFDETANSRQVENKSHIEEKEADSVNNGKKESSRVKEISEVIETKKQKENKFPSNLKAFSQKESQNKTSKLLQKNNEIENKSTNLAKEKEVCNQTDEKEKPNNVPQNVLSHDNEVINEKRDTKFDGNTNSRQIENKSQIEEKEAGSFNNGKKDSSIKEISEVVETKKQKENKSLSKVKASIQKESQNETPKLLQKNNEIENKSTNLAKNEVVNQTGEKEKLSNEIESQKTGINYKEPVIDISSLRKILRKKLNSTHGGTNNMESNVTQKVKMEYERTNKIRTAVVKQTMYMENTATSQIVNMNNKISQNRNVENGTTHESVNVENETKCCIATRVASSKTDMVNRIPPQTAIGEINTTCGVKPRVPIQNPSMDELVPPQGLTIKNRDQSTQDIELIRQLEAEIEEIGRKNLPTQMPNIRQVAANTQVQENAQLQPINLPGTSRQVSGNRSQNLSSNYEILPSTATANTSQPAIFNASIAQMPNIRGEVLANTHMLKKAPLQRSNLPVTSTQVSDDVDQKHLPTPLIYSVPSESLTNVNQSSTWNLIDPVPPTTGNPYLLAGQNLIFVPLLPQIFTPMPQLQTSNNNRSVVLSPSFQITSSSIPLQFEPSSTSTDNATDPFVL